jgi:putative addiction module component (TIGR02574 family)
MSRAAEDVFEAAMTLSEAERAEVAARLHESLDKRFVDKLEAEWDAEIARRLKAIDEGSAELIPAEEVHRELRQKYSFFKG